MEIPRTSDRGGWGKVLLVLLLIERAAAWGAFPLDDLSREIADWEMTFWISWGLGLLLLALMPLALRRRAGGWLSALSGLLLIARSCLPLLGEKPAAGAVITLMVASATLTFAFLYEQSYWPVSADTPPEDQPDYSRDEDREDPRNPG